MEHTAHAIINNRCYRVRYCDETDEVTISQHAVERYREYGYQDGHRTATDEALRCGLRRLLLISRQVQLKPKFRAAQLAQHGADHIVSYRRAGGFVLVLVDSELRTIHRNEAKRWRDFPEPE